MQVTSICHCPSNLKKFGVDDNWVELFHPPMHSSFRPSPAWKSSSLAAPTARGRKLGFGGRPPARLPYVANKPSYRNPFVVAPSTQAPSVPADDHCYAPAMVSYARTFSLLLLQFAVLFMQFLSQSPRLPFCDLLVVLNLCLCTRLPRRKRRSLPPRPPRAEAVGSRRRRSGARESKRRR
jgi:hypothetical protein